MVTFDQFFKLFLTLGILKGINSSKLNTLVLQNSEDIFGDQTQLKKSNGSVWENEGYIVANASQISNSLGKTVNGSTHLLLATKSSTLTTQLKDFDHTFLSIKFFSIIGRSVPEKDASLSTKPSTRIEDAFTTTTALPPTIPVTKSILKLNTGSNDGHVIEIEIDHPVTSPVVVSPSVTKEPAAGKKPRVKRTLNSEEISQIHKIISSASGTSSSGGKKDDHDDRKVEVEENNNDKKKDEKVKIKTKSHSSERVEEPDVKVQKEKKHHETNSKNKKLPYETWRASMDKSFRPPGFYVTVDDKVIFDNWIGVWQNPSVMGRWISPTKKTVWNETDLLLEFDEDPDRDVKISFEWEPMDAYSYLFLSNITIFTYGSNVTVQTILLNNTSPGNNQNPSTITGIGEGNKNITLYIVVKQPPSENGQSSPASGNSEAKSTKSDAGSEGNNGRHDKMTTGNTDSRRDDMTKDTSKSRDDYKVMPKNPSGSQEEETKGRQQISSEVNQGPKYENKFKNNGQTGLIVASVIGLISFFILGALIHKRIQLSRRQGRGC